MKSSERSPYLVNKAMKHFLLATVLSMAAGQVSVTIDGIIVSHLVSPDALSAVNLFTPLSLLVSSFATFFGIGATIRAARAIGEQDREKAGGLLSTAVLSMVFIGILVGILSFIFQDRIVALISHEERLSGYFKEYEGIMLGCCVVTMMNTLFNEMVCIDGHPRIATRATLISTGTNVALSAAFVGLLHLGVSGSAFATVLSLLLNIALVSRYLFGDGCSFSLRPLKSFSIRSLVSNMQQGAPLVIGNLLLMVMFLFLNNIVQSKQGADGMFAMSICMNLLTLGMMVSGSVGATAMSVGGFLYGQKDFEGVRILVGRCVRLVLVVLVVVLAVVEIAPGIVTGLFGADTPELAAYSDRCLRIFAWMLPLILMVLLLANIYQMLGYLTLSPLLILLFPVVLLPGMLLLARIDGSLIWYAFPLTGIVVASVTFAATSVIRLRKNRTVTVLTLVPLFSDRGNRLNISIRMTSDEIAASLDKFVDVLGKIVSDGEKVTYVRLCLEELLQNIYHHGRVSDSHFVDLFACKEKDTLTVAVKDDGRSFDPTLVKDSDMGFGLRIVKEFSDSIEYKYMFGQNMTFLKFTL